MKFLTRATYFLAIVCLSWSLALFNAPSTSYAESTQKPIQVFHHNHEVVYDSLEVLPQIEEDIPCAPQPVVPEEPQSPWVVKVRMLVTACSPEDSIDVAYYARHGYEGATYNIAADTRILPRGTQMRVPGYMPVSFPGRWWVVDSAGGSIIRRASRRGIIQIDVKFRTEHSALRWGRQWLDVEVIIPDTPEGHRLYRRLLPHIVEENP